MGGTARDVGHLARPPRRAPTGHPGHDLERDLFSLLKQQMPSCERDVMKVGLPPSSRQQRLPAAACDAMSVTAESSLVGPFQHAGPADRDHLGYTVRHLPCWPRRCGAGVPTNAATPRLPSRPRGRHGRLPGPVRGMRRLLQQGRLLVRRARTFPDGRLRRDRRDPGVARDVRLITHPSPGPNYR